MNEQELILTALRGCERTDLYVDPRPLSVGEREFLRNVRQRRLSNEPLQYILGQADFMGLTFSVDARVLIPRPETEVLAATAIQQAALLQRKPLRILDLGTGSGNLAVTLAKMIDSAQVTAVDISMDALAVARANARRHGVERVITFIAGDLHDFMESAFRKDTEFDMIVSNPPYIPGRRLADLSADVRREPAVALDGGPDGLDFIRFIIDRADNILASCGLLAMEIGDGQRAATENCLRQKKIYRDIAFIRDCSQTDRVARATLR